MLRGSRLFNILGLKGGVILLEGANYKIELIRASKSKKRLVQFCTTFCAGFFFLFMGSLTKKLGRDEKPKPVMSEKMFQRVLNE